MTYDTNESLTAERLGQLRSDLDRANELVDTLGDQICDIAQDSVTTAGSTMCSMRRGRSASCARS